MRAFSSDLKTQAGAEVTYLGWLLAITPLTLPEVFLTTIGANYTHGGDVYLGDPGFGMGSARFSDGSDPASLDITIPVSDDGPVMPDNVTAGLYQGAVVAVYLVDYVNADVSPAIGFRFRVGATRITNDGQAVFEIRAETRIRRELALKTFTPTCPYNVGDARCGVNMAAFTDTVEVDSVTSLYEFTVTGSSRADGFFDNGALRFSSGDNTGRAYTVRKWTLSTRQVLLWEPLRSPVIIGNDATIHAGCDKTRGAAGCTKFSNIARFGGFGDMPPDDAKFSHEPVEATAAQPVVTQPTPASQSPQMYYQWTTGMWKPRTSTGRSGMWA